MGSPGVKLSMTACGFLTQAGMCFSGLVRWSINGDWELSICQTGMWRGESEAELAKCLAKWKHSGSEVVVSVWRVLLEAENLGVQEYLGWRGSVSQDFSSEDSLLSQSPGFQQIPSFFYKFSTPKKQLELLKTQSQFLIFLLNLFCVLKIFLWWLF